MRGKVAAVDAGVDSRASPVGATASSPSFRFEIEASVTFRETGGVAVRITRVQGIAAMLSSLRSP